MESRPTLPHPEFLQKPAKVSINPYLYEAIRNFESNIKTKGRIYDDSLWHNDSTNALKAAFWDMNKLKDKGSIIDIIDKNTMTARGKTVVLANISKNYNRFINLLSWLKDDTVSIDERLEKSIGKHSQYGIENGGFFFITQIISGLFPEYFTVIEYNAIKSMLRFELIDINLKVETVKEYLYFNKICTDLFLYFENPVKFNLSYVHNFLWHYEKDYLKNGKWL